MHMKLSLLSSDMDTASNTSIYICARYTSVYACCILCVMLSNLRIDYATTMNG